MDISSGLLTAILIAIGMVIMALSALSTRRLLPLLYNTRFQAPAG